MQVNKKKMLVTGASGMLGNNLAYYFREKYEVIGLYNSHAVNIYGVQTQRADIFFMDYFNKIVTDLNPDVLIHCVALTDVDRCEFDQQLADDLNVEATRTVVDNIKDRGTKLIYISSDSVYDGGRGNFTEEDQVSPQNYYGASKYKGELETLKIKNSLVFRTNFFGWNIQDKHSLGEWILHELSNGKPIQGFSDVFFSSIYTFDFAEIMDIAIDLDLTGVFNCGSSTSISKYEFAMRIAERFNLDKSLVKSISIDDFALKARRGKNLTLSVEKLTRATNHTPPSINESIEAFYKDSARGLPKKIKNANV